MTTREALVFRIDDFSFRLYIVIVVVVVVVIVTVAVQAVIDARVAKSLL